MKRGWIIVLALGCAAFVVIANIPRGAVSLSSAQNAVPSHFHGVTPRLPRDMTPPQPRKVTSFTVYNAGEAAVSNQQITLAQPFQTGDVAAVQKIQIRKNDGAEILTGQED